MTHSQENREGNDMDIQASSPAASKTPKRKPLLCFEIDISSRIALERLANKRFRVTYGKQVKSQLNYNDAAAELGLVLMHALQCEGRLDNEDT
jgi:hypothetical protein